MKKHTIRIGIAAAALGLCMLPFLTSAQSVSGSAQQIAALLAQLAAIQAQLQTLQQPTLSTASQPAASTQPAAVSDSICYALNRSLSLGSSGSDVLALQQYLIGQGLLGAGYASGSFDLSTQSAVQKWQVAYGIVSSGSPSSTGWGVVGPRTRQLLQLNCNIPSASASATQQCPLAPQPSIACAGTWSAITNGNGCTTLWQCAIPLTQPSPTTSNGCAAAPAQPTAQCVGGSWQPTYNGTSCKTGWQCVPTTSSAVFSASPMSGTAPLFVTFSAHSTGGVSIDLGDGQAITPTLDCSTGSCALVASHMYTSVGTYTARLIQGTVTLGAVTISTGN